MKTVVKVKLLPDAAASVALTDTLALCNQQANTASAVARARKITRKRDLQTVTYADNRAAGLSSQLAILVSNKVAAAYATHRANLRAGNYGTNGTARHAAAAATVISFRPDAAQAFDDRVLSWDHNTRTVSIWTTHGRLTIPFTGHPAHLADLAAHRKGETDLLLDRQGCWYLVATLDIAEPVPVAPNGFTGVDMGVTVIAATAHVTPSGTASAGTDWSGGAITLRRKKNQHLRTRLQKKGTKSAKRLLQKRSGKESRFVKDANHQISKTIVAEAKRTGRGIAVEDLTGIRARVRHRTPQRATFHSWAFAQLGAFLAYKAQRAGVAFTQVDPAYTSQTCSGCGYTDKKNRRTQADFTCLACGVSLNADTNAAINIAARGLTWWQGPVNVPHAA